MYIFFLEILTSIKIKLHKQIPTKKILQVNKNILKKYKHHYQN